MRRASIISSILLPSFVAAATPLQRSHNQRDYSLSSSKPLRISTESELGIPWHVKDIEGPWQERKRDLYNCTDLGAAFDSHCWVDLNLTAWIFNWNATTRVCGTEETADDNDGSNCCKPDEPWTTCFLRLAHGSPGQDCSQINPQTCTYSSTLDPYMDPSIKPEVQYVMKNIYCKLNVEPSTH